MLSLRKVGAAVIQEIAKDEADTTQTVTLTYQLPSEVVQALQEEAARNGRSLEDEILQFLSKTLPRPKPATPTEIERRKVRFRRFIGAWNSGDPDSSDNERIDADLAREYGEGLDSYGSGDAT